MTEEIFEGRIGIYLYASRGVLGNEETHERRNVRNEVDLSRPREYYRTIELSSDNPIQIRIVNGLFPLKEHRIQSRVIGERRKLLRIIPYTKKVIKEEQITVDLPHKTSDFLEQGGRDELAFWDQWGILNANGKGLDFLVTVIFGDDYLMNMQELSRQNPNLVREIGLRTFPAQFQILKSVISDYTALPRYWLKRTNDGKKWMKE